MTSPEVLAEMIRIVKDLAEAAKEKFNPRSEKKWKDLSGTEWTQRCLDADWEKNRK